MLKVIFICFLQPLMLIVPDVQDVYTPLESDVIVQLAEVSFFKLCGITCGHNEFQL